MGAFLVHGKRVDYDTNSLYIFKSTMSIRIWVVWLIEWKYFDNFIMICILGNSISLAMYDYADPDALQTKN